MAARSGTAVGNALFYRSTACVLSNKLWMFDTVQVIRICRPVASQAHGISESISVPVSIRGEHNVHSMDGERIEHTKAGRVPDHHESLRYAQRSRAGAGGPRILRIELS